MHSERTGFNLGIRASGRLDPFVEASAKVPCLRTAAVSWVVFALRNYFSRHAERFVCECELRPH
jgi:hypothetical protein